MMPAGDTETSPERFETPVTRRGGHGGPPSIYDFLIWTADRRVRLEIHRSADLSFESLTFRVRRCSPAAMRRSPQYLYVAVTFRYVPDRSPTFFSTSPTAKCSNSNPKVIVSVACQLPPRRKSSPILRPATPGVPG